MAIRQRTFAAAMYYLVCLKADGWAPHAVSAANIIASVSSIPSTCSWWMKRIPSAHCGLRYRQRSRRERCARCKKNPRCRYNTAISVYRDTVFCVVIVVPLKQYSMARGRRTRLIHFILQCVPLHFEQYFVSVL